MALVYSLPVLDSACLQIVIYLQLVYKMACVFTVGWTDKRYCIAVSVWACFMKFGEQSRLSLCGRPNRARYRSCLLCLSVPFGLLCQKQKPRKPKISLNVPQGRSTVRCAPIFTSKGWLDCVGQCVLHRQLWVHCVRARPLFGTLSNCG